MTIQPTKGESWGRRVLVTLRFRFRGVKSLWGTLQHKNYVYLGYNGKTLLDYSHNQGDSSWNRTVSFYATVGSTFTVCMLVNSYAPSDGSVSALASLDMYVQ